MPPYKRAIEGTLQFPDHSPKVKIQLRNELRDPEWLDLGFLHKKEAGMVVLSLELEIKHKVL